MGRQYINYLPHLIRLMKKGAILLTDNVLQDGDLFDPEKGLAMCIAKKALGNKPNFNKIFKKWIPTEVEKDLTIQEAVDQIATEWQKLTDEEKDIVIAILLDACGKDSNAN